MIMPAMKLPCTSCLVDQKENATQGDVGPGIQGSANKAKKFLVIKSEHGENFVPYTASNRAPRDVSKRIRVAIAEEARAVPLFDSAVRGPTMEPSFQKARAHPWWDVCNDRAEVMNPFPNRECGVISQDS